jgi:hypothetical protein
LTLSLDTGGSMIVNTCGVLKKSLRVAIGIWRKRVRRSHALLDFDRWRPVDHDGQHEPL